ncbi:hypothetical protein [Paenibacillus graminis]|uniref:hypothetical protein n=1 Tax=Paenibacillus graminis TaxID=189425 RepID=UPI002DB7560C|nr:hypothetical protein [Paenibacillus graminis]MEC0167904.1 hypothetical protein [Paenibacillus graminis]
MAKLSVVIPAVDVMVNGQAYRKVDRKAQAGDIVKALSRSFDVDTGAFYAVEVDASRGVFYRDNVGSRRFRLERTDLHEVYAPVAAAPSETITYENAQYRKVDRPAREGDVVMITEPDDAEYTADEGVSLNQPYLVMRLDSADDPQIMNARGKEYDTAGDVFDVYEKVTRPSVEYREVKRYANVGDTIKMVEDADAGGWLAGDTFIVTSVASDKAVHFTDNDGDGRRRSGTDDYVVLEPIVATTPTYVEVKRKASVGERIKIVAAENAHGKYANGDELTVASDDHLWGEAVRVNEFYQPVLYDREYVVLEPVPAQAIAKPKRYAVGDFVKVTGNSVTHDYAEGSVVKITETKDNARHGGQQFHAETADGERGNWLVTNDVEPATKAEFLAAKAQTQRKPAEPAFSVGDTVKLTVADGGRPCYGWGRVSNGDIGKVAYVSSDSISVDFPKQRGWNAKPEELTKVDPRDAFAEGDKVRLISGGNTSGLHDYETGDVYTVLAPKSPVGNGKVKITGGGQPTGYATPDQLVKLTAEEVAAIQKEAQEAVKWVAIGRKVGEFKRGDIVSFTRTDGDKGVGTVEDGGSFDSAIGVRIGAKPYDGEKYRGVYFDEGDTATLIVPVEQRFDTAA